MQHTLFAVFDNRNDAQSAMDELLLSGFSQSDVRLAEDSSGIGDTTTERTEDEGIGASIKHFFSDLFGSDDDVYSHKYSTAVSKGHYVVTVTAVDEPGVERAADIVERFGPVDIDEKAAEWGGAPAASAGAMRMGSAGARQQSEATTLHFQGDRNLFAQQSLNDERPMGQTYQESMGAGEELSTGRFGSTQGESLTGSLQRDTGMSGGSAMGNSGSAGPGSAAMGLGSARREVQRGSSRVYSPYSADQSDTDDDSYNRRHWDSTYSASGRDYDDYTPAYSYGREVANMYRGQPWNDVEMDVRKGWESRSASTGESTWDEFKEAIRHGWNRLTH
ncbi:MAG TPA: hypothetical protein VGD30_18850 [Telluria sp.]